MDLLNEDVRVARSVRSSALSVDGVYSMGRGTYAEAATYGAGEKVEGVVVGPDQVRLYVIVSYPSSLSVLSVAKRVREAATPAAEGRVLSLIVEDLGPAPGESSGAASEATPAVRERR